MQSWFNIQKKQINVIHHVNKLQKKITRSYQPPIIIKTANQKFENILNLFKKHLQKPAVNILLNGETISFLTKTRWKEKMSLITTPFQHYTGRCRECNKTRKGKLYLLADDIADCLCRKSERISKNIPGSNKWLH